MKKSNPIFFARKAAVLLVIPVLGGLARAADVLRLAPGATAPVELAENPSTGYSWRIDADASSGLDHVAIIDGGHRRGASMPGAPGSRHWTLRALSPGEATVIFAYQRPWEPEPIETREVKIEIAPRKRK